MKYIVPFLNNERQPSLSRKYSRIKNWQDLATYNDYIILCFHFVIPFGYIFNFFITDIIPLVLPRKKLTVFSLHYLVLLTGPTANLMKIYDLFWQIWCQRWSTLYRF